VNPHAALGHADRHALERGAVPVAAGEAVDLERAGVAVEGEGPGTARVDHRGIAAGAEQAAARLDLDLGTEPVGARRHEDGGVLVERGLEGGAVVGAAVAHRPVIPDRDHLAELLREAAVAAARQAEEERQGAERCPAGGIASCQGDDELVLGREPARRLLQLVDLLNGH
jgi:hypothetical protein